MAHPMRLSPVLVAVALVTTLAGCDRYEATLPDGGRGRVNCTDNNVKVPVTLLDRGGSPLANAGVVATYVSIGEEEVFTTGGDGVAIITDKGPGIVRVQGQYNDLASPVGELTFTGGECSTAVTPRSITLQLQ